MAVGVNESRVNRKPGGVKDLFAVSGGKGRGDFPDLTVFRADIGRVRRVFSWVQYSKKRRALQFPENAAADGILSLPAACP